MSFSFFEGSIFAGRPVELFEFNITGASYTYSTASRPNTFQNKIYNPLAINRSSLNGGATIDKASLKVQMPANADIGDLWLTGTPPEVMSLTVYRIHSGDPDFSVLWKGRALSAGWDTKRLTINCESIHTSLRRAGLRRNYQTHCPHIVYGPGCELAENAFRVQGQVASINGNVIEVAAAAGYGVDYFTGGYVRWVSAETGGTVSRMIDGDNNNGFLTVLPLPTNLAGGQNIDVFPGCPRTLQDCNDKFSNADNYGGMPFIPTKNPFDGSNIW